MYSTYYHTCICVQFASQEPYSLLLQMARRRIVWGTGCDHVRFTDSERKGAFDGIAGWDGIGCLMKKVSIRFQDSVMYPRALRRLLTQTLNWLLVRSE